MKCRYSQFVESTIVDGRVGKVTTELESNSVILTVPSFWENIGNFYVAAKFYFIANFVQLLILYILFYLIQIQQIMQTANLIQRAMVCVSLIFSFFCFFNLSLFYVSKFLIIFYDNNSRSDNRRSGWRSSWSSSDCWSISNCCQNNATKEIVQDIIIQGH